MKKPRGKHLHFIAWANIEETLLMVGCTREVLPDMPEPNADPEISWPWMTYKKENVTCPACKEVAAVEELRAFLVWKNVRRRA